MTGLCPPPSQKMETATATACAAWQRQHHRNEYSPSHWAPMTLCLTSSTNPKRDEEEEVCGGFGGVGRWSVQGRGQALTDEVTQLPYLWLTAWHHRKFSTNLKRVVVDDIGVTIALTCFEPYSYKTKSPGIERYTIKKQSNYQGHSDEKEEEEEFVRD